MVDVSARPATGLADRPAASDGRAGPGPWRAARRRRRVPYLALGALLVVVCVLGFAYAAAQLGERVSVLAVARPVSAGQVIAAADLKAVSAADDATLGLIPASSAGSVVGRTAAVPLLPGTLLTRAVLGDPQDPPAGKVTASLALKPGQYPQGLQPGASVAVFVASAAPAAGQNGASGSGATSTPARLSAVVRGVDLAGDGQGNTVVTLELNASDAGRLAGAAAGGVVLMQTAPGGG
jgi:hypothetical protein